MAAAIAVRRRRREQVVLACLDWQKQKPSLSCQGTDDQIERWPSACCALCVPSVFTIMDRVSHLSDRATESELHLLLNICQRHLFHWPPHLFYLKRFYNEVFFSFVLLLTSYHFLLISSVVVFSLTHSIYFLADTLPYRVSLNYSYISLLQLNNMFVSLLLATCLKTTVSTMFAPVVIRHLFLVDPMQNTHNSNVQSVLTHTQFSTLYLGS